MRTEEEIRQMYEDVCKLEETEYIKGFKDALKMVLHEE